MDKFLLGTDEYRAVPENVQDLAGPAGHLPHRGLKFDAAGARC
jgi:hypothetical protein